MLSTSLTRLATRIAEQLTPRRQTVAVAETSTGGLISAALLSVPGASAYYRGGTVTYTRDGVAALLAGATDMEPGDRGACEPFARYLAASVAAKLGADWAVSEAGAAGPSATGTGIRRGTHGWRSQGRTDTCAPSTS